MASTVDLGVTILDRAGVRPYFGVQGRSALPAIRGEADHRDGVLIEFNDSGRRMGFAEAARMRAWVTPGWHLAVYRGEDWGEFYDRRSDRGHCRNLWDDPEHAAVKADMVLALSHALIGQMDESPRSRRLA